MSDDLISRQAAISFIENVPYIKSHQNMGDLIKAWLEQIPAVQPEQKIGRWIEYCGDLHCSVCGFRNSDHYCLGKGIACPNCGAFVPDGLKNVLG